MAGRLVIRRDAGLPGPFVPGSPDRRPGGAAPGASERGVERTGASAVYVASPHAPAPAAPRPAVGEGEGEGEAAVAPGSRRAAFAGDLPGAALAGELRSAIRVVRDFPRPGARFWDVTPILQSAELFRRVVAALAEGAEARGAEAIAGIDPRGILFAPAVALELALPFIPVAAPGTLPGDTSSAERRHERAVPLRLAVQKGRIPSGRRVAVLDDLLVSGSTAVTAARLLEELGAIVAGIGVVAEVRTGQPPRDTGRYNVFSLLIL